MKDLFESTNYVEFLNKLIQAKNAERGIQTRFAKAMNCQAAYFSQVLKGNANLSEDQAIKLCRHLGLTDIASDYFMILVQIARASTQELKHYLETKKENIAADYLEAHSRINSKRGHLPIEALQTYFSSWIPSTIHMATSSDQYRTVEHLAKRFDLSSAEVIKTLEFLIRIGMVTEKEGQYFFSGESLHFSKQSPINETIQVNRRLHAIKSIQRKNARDLHFTSIFTIDTKTFKTLKEDILKLIEQAHQQIHSSGSDEVYGLCIDFFEA